MLNNFGATCNDPVKFCSGDNEGEISDEQRDEQRRQALDSQAQSNGMAESFVKTFKRDYASLANRPDSQTVMRELKLWFEHYNGKHPHIALGYLPPRRFRDKQKSIN